MPNQNMGSFGAATGGADALKAAMQRRGVDASVLDQMTPGAPGPASPVAPTIPETNPQIGAVSAPAPEAGLANLFRSAEAEIALKALAGVAKTESKIAEAALGLQ